LIGIFCIEKQIHQLYGSVKVHTPTDAKHCDTPNNQDLEMSTKMSGSCYRPLIDTGECTQSAAQTGVSDAGAPSPLASTPSAQTSRLAIKTSQLLQLEAHIASLPVVDSQRVQDLQHAIATNTLALDPARVADKLLSVEAGLAGQGNN
jgi:flagellar biosynthesis anti-sigma factor FlgM